MKKILIIEDNLDIRENIAEILELAQYEVETAEDGKKGVKKAFSFTPDLILCDIMMPELDGYGVKEILEENKITASIPFIFLTAKAEKEDFRKGMNLGADDYLIKPFEELDLLQTIKRRLKKIETIQQSITPTQQAENTHFFSESIGLQKLIDLANNREVISYQKKQLLFTEGAYPHKLFYLKSGKIKTYRSNEMGKELITEVFKKGDFIGYQALVENKPYVDTAMAMENSEVAIIPKDDFFILLHNDRDVANKFIQMLSYQLTEQEERLLNLAYNSVRRRLADTLVMLVEKQESDNQSLHISREDLANIAGTSKETIIRNLSEFKSEGLIKIESNIITILNIEKLKYIIG